MGWFDAVFGKRSSDPFETLDPKLRDFLNKESPFKPQPAAAQQQQDQAQRQDPPPATEAAAAADKQRPKVPPQSLFPDGRYAYLWKTYRPLAEIEDETKSDQERFMDVVSAYKDRKAEIGRAALENCSIQQEEWEECLTSGSWSDRMQLCSAQMKRFEKCYTTQARLLKALGYHSAWGRPAAVEEEIQMHADGLYTRILEHEAAVEEAKREGRPAPVFDPRLRQRQEEAHRRQHGGADPVEPTDRLRTIWDRELEKLPEEMREVQEAALRAELQVKRRLGEELNRIRGRAEEAKNKKKEEAAADADADAGAADAVGSREGPQTIKGPLQRLVGKIWG